MSRSNELQMTYRPIDELKPSPGNPRTHSPKQIKQLERSIREFGFVNPVLVDGDDRIVAGHGRVSAARNVGLTQVPVVCVGHLTPAQTKAYLIADNKLAENAGWDMDLLKAELKELSYNLDFDLTLTGFETPNLDLLLGVDQEPGQAEKPVPPPDRSGLAVSRPGDIWRIGDQMVICGDATDEAAYRQLMGNETAGLVFTDPPYNVPIAGHVSGLGQITHREFAMASGEMSEAEFTAFLAKVFQQLVAFSGDGSLHYICMDWRHIMEVLTAAKGVYSELKNLCVWCKTNGGMGNLYRSRHELVFVYKNGSAPHTNNVELGKHGRNRTNVWEYPGANAFGGSRDTDLAMHPTVKPVQLVADAILDTSNRGDLVLDAFGGSGTTLVAAEQTGRRGRAIEIDPHYVDTIVNRLERATGTKATHGHSSETFETLKAWRRSGVED
ncbi:MAG: ParB N-terminal domain-containing protein [Alphaproteobacteria bacterium]|nr:ParB N-terminal domain-containing protein [Alphaproteobacteria bacterium]